MKHNNTNPLNYILSSLCKFGLENDDNFDCQTCDNRFGTISGLMKHRKVEHPDTVPICKAVKDGLAFDYKENCWFSNLNQKGKPKLV